MKRISLILILIVFVTFIYGQNLKTSLGLAIDTTNNKELRDIYILWQNYLKNNPDSIFDNPYWNKDEKQKYLSYDLLKSEAWLAPSLYGLRPDNSVLEIKNNGDFYVIKSIFYWVYPETYKVTTLAVTNVIAKKENGEFKLYNNLPYHTKNWYRKKVGIIQYIYHPLHPFNDFKAQKANELISNLKKTFDIKVDKVEYYIALNCDEIFKLKGFEFVLGMGRTPNLCGFYDRFNNIIYSNSIEGEFYVHEIIHLINNFFPNGVNLFFQGLSAYWGGQSAHVGKSIIYHIKRMDKYLKEHNEIDLTDLSNFYQMDDQTSPSYILGAILCHLTLEKGGLPLFKKGLNYGDTDEDMYRFIDEELGVKQKDLNNFMRKKISEYAKDGLIPIKIESK